MAIHKILCLGDLHLGVRPSRLPAAVAPEVASVAAVWRRAVDLALEEGVGLVLLSGDVVDRANRYFEGFGRLEEGVRRLTENGVEVCAVAGNHDFDVLPRLVEAVGGERCRLLGTGGSWQRWSWQEPRGEVLLHVDGWSFPGKNVREDPVARYDLAPPGDDAPLLGLVHGDLGQPASTNAPLARASLERAGPAAWLLGHVHKPELFELAGGRWALYPGSPQPLDPTEEGPHGAWLLELEAGRLGRPRQVPLATVRWETVEVDLSGARDLEECQDRLAVRARNAARETFEADRSDLSHLVLKARLVGRTQAHRRLAGLARALMEETLLDFDVGGGRAALGQVRVATRPPIDLRRLATADDSPGLLAGLLLALEGEAGAGATEAPLPALVDLRAGVQERVRAVYDHRPYLPVRAQDEPEEDPGGGDGRERLARVASDLLDALLAQKETRPELEAPGERHPRSSAEAR
ncbi:MAG TPA: DNA repair exonuclease [Thermoanaerobaculia bacterium]|nr:DNA repair exonuclease [Thermoanaerobaculia bacterium]